MRRSSSRMRVVTRCRNRAIVRDRDRRERGPAARQQRLEPLDALDVQVVRRLVEEQQVGLAGEGAADRHALLPPAGQRRDRRVGPEAAARGVERQRREHPALLLVRVGAVVRGVDPLQDGVAHRGAVREPRRLVQERDAQSAPPRDRAAVSGRGLGQDAQQRRFARAVRADEADALLLVDREADAVEEGARAEGRRQLLRIEEDCHARALTLRHRAAVYIPRAASKRALLRSSPTLEAR